LGARGIRVCPRPSADEPYPWATFENGHATAPPALSHGGAPHRARVAGGLLRLRLAAKHHSRGLRPPIRGREPHHITVPVHAGTTRPAPPPVLSPAPPDPPTAPGSPFSIGGGPAPTPSATGARVETPFSWLWWWWYFDLERRSLPRLSSIWTRWTSQGGLVGAVSTALFGDYTRSFWMILATAIIGVAFAGIGYCLWCCTHALAMCCSPCRCCGRRIRIRGKGDPSTLSAPEEAPPLRGPHGLRPTDNDLYASIKCGSQTRRATPRHCSRRGSHRAAGSAGGRCNPSG